MFLFFENVKNHTKMTSFSQGRNCEEGQNFPKSVAKDGVQNKTKMGRFQEGQKNLSKRHGIELTYTMGLQKSFKTFL